jgi:predicted AAA+ superfamily ATPase
MVEYVERLVDGLLDEFLPYSAAIVLEGPKGVGKTATAQRRAKTVFRLDNPLDAEAVRADPGLLAQGPVPVLIDEWQYLPDVWNEVRRWVDDGAQAGSFLLTGSADPVGARIHSGAGRIDRIRLRPLSLAERRIDTPAVSLDRLLSVGAEPVRAETKLRVEDYSREIAASGFPAIRPLPVHLRSRRIASYLDQVVRRDFPQQGLRVRQPDTLRRWLRAFAQATGTTASYSAILDAATSGEGDKPAKTTAIAYRDVLDSLWLLDQLEPWDPGDAKTGPLARTPKHFLSDPAFAVSLLGLDEGALTRRVSDNRFGPRYGSLAGRLFEALIALSVRTYAQHAGGRVSYLRTYSGAHEVDLIVQRGRSVVGIEVKLAADVQAVDVKHLVWLRQILGDDFAAGVVVYTGSRAYRRSEDGILVVPAGLLGP